MGDYNLFIMGSEFNPQWRVEICENKEVKEKKEILKY